MTEAERPAEEPAQAAKRTRRRKPKPPAEPPPEGVARIWRELDGDEDLESVVRSTPAEPPLLQRAWWAAGQGT